MKIDTCYFSPSPPPTADCDLLMAVPFSKVTHTPVPPNRLCSPWGSCPDRQRGLVGCWATPSRARPGWQNDGAFSGSTAHILCNSCLSQSDDFILTATIPPGRLLDAIAPMKLISVLTYVRRSNTRVFHLFVSQATGYDQPTPKLKPPPGCGGKINCPLQSGCT